MPHSAIQRRTRRQAQSLRRRPTDAEQKIWRVLRSLKPLGIHFRRQAPIGNYITDFAWHGGKLIVELDGGQHAEVRRSYDNRRSAWLSSQGYRVLRFWNHDALKAPEAVGEAILAAARTSAPPPTPPHKGEGSKPAQAAKLVRTTDASKSDPAPATQFPSPLWGGVATPDLIGGSRGGVKLGKSNPND
jgi:very-short-patch-repair endonuclease